MDHRIKPRNKPSAIRENAPPLIHRLRQLRLDAGLTQETVATLMGAQPSQFSQWERGVKDPGLCMVMKWARALRYQVTIVED